MKNRDTPQENLMRGVLALAVSLSEIIKDALKLQSLHRMEQSGLSEEEIESWRDSLMDLDAALDQIRGNDGVLRLLHQGGHSFDALVDHLLSAVLNSSPSPHREERLEGGAGGTTVQAHAP